MSWCEDYIDPFPRDCEHGVPDGINCDDCADEGLESEDEDEQPFIKSRPDGPD